MICIISLFIFGVLGIFSAHYRHLAKESFRCVFLRMTFRACDTKLDERIKSKLISKLLNFNPSMAKFVYKRFEILSWLFTIMFFASMIYSFYGIYNLFVFGTCDSITGICPFDMSSPICGCENVCLCDNVTCESPDYLACGGDCNCQKDVCGW